MQDNLSKETLLENEITLLRDIADKASEFLEAKMWEDEDEEEFAGEVLAKAINDLRVWKKNNK